MKPKTENFDTTCHLFNLEFAKRYGVFASILIYDIDYWIAHNKANAKHCIDGKTWTYNSAHAFTSLFPYLTTYQIKHTLKKLCEDRVLMKEQFRKKQYDHSNWYTFTDEFLKKFTPLLRCCRQKITPSDTIEATPEAPETRLVEFPQSADLLCPISTNSVNSASRPETTDPLPSLSGHQQSTTLLQGEQKKQKSEKQQTYQQHQQSSSAAVPQRNAEDDVSKKARKDGKRKDGKQVSDPDVEKSQQRQTGKLRKATGLKKSSIPQSPLSPFRYPTKDDAKNCLNSTAAGTMIGQVLSHVSELKGNTLMYILFQKQVSIDDLWAAIYHGKHCWGQEPLKRMSSWLMSDKPWKGEQCEFCQSNDSDKDWKEAQHLPAAIRWYYSLPVEQREQVASSAQTDNPEWWVSPGFVNQIMRARLVKEAAHA